MLVARPKNRKVKCATVPHRARMISRILPHVSWLASFLDHADPSYLEIIRARWGTVAHLTFLYSRVAVWGVHLELTRDHGE
jgi:hypothetical protein